MFSTPISDEESTCFLAPNKIRKQYLTPVKKPLESFSTSHKCFSFGEALSQLHAKKRQRKPPLPPTPDCPKTLSITLASHKMSPLCYQEEHPREGPDSTFWTNIRPKDNYSVSLINFRHRQTGETQHTTSPHWANPSWMGDLRGFNFYIEPLVTFLLEVFLRNLNQQVIPSGMFPKQGILR